MDEDQEDIEEDPEGEAEDQLLAKLGTEVDSSLFDIRYLTCSSIKGNHKVPIITNPADLSLCSVDQRERERSPY